MDNSVIYLISFVFSLGVWSVVHTFGNLVIFLYEAHAADLLWVYQDQPELIPQFVFNAWNASEVYILLYKNDVLVKVSRLELDPNITHPDGKDYVRFGLHHKKVPRPGMHQFSLYFHGNREARFFVTIPPELPQPT